MPMKEIAARLGVSSASVHVWTRDIGITAEQASDNLLLGRQRCASRWIAINRRRRLSYQVEGRHRAREGDPLHQAGCMLYWAEGAKDRNSLTFANSDIAMVRYFVRFLVRCFGVDADSLTMRLNVYTSNGLSIASIEEHWLDALDLPRSCIRKHILDHRPTSSSGRRSHKLPYGVCTVRVEKSTRIVQHIYGAIQEYAGFDEPRWLD
jgi:hypothetical protein